MCRQGDGLGSGFFRLIKLVNAERPPTLSPAAS
jgi:hypothetical protein